MRLCLFAGTSNRPLAQKIAETLGTSLSTATLRRFSDGEVFVEINENVRGKDVYILQSTCPPVNDNLMELLIMVDALKRASVNSVTAVLPYYGYARQDRKVAPRTPITAKLVADILTSAGCSRVVSMDLHAGQIQGFFNIPFDNLYALPVIVDYIKTLFKDGSEIVLVSPDAGGVERARAFAKRLNASVAMIDKRRTGPNVAKAMNLIGNVEGLNAVILDDMIDTAGTLIEAAETVKKHGAKTVYAAATHAILSGPASTRIRDSILEEVIVTDTIPLREEARGLGKLKVLSTAGLLAEAIRRIHSYESVSSLFV
ncbi:MAG: ribose-phosphate pyrophosphokinase [Bdellovibrionota bacterium]